MAADVEYLLELKEEIENAKPEIHRLEGKLSSLMDTLKEEYSCSSKKELEKLIESTEQEISDLESDIEKEINELKEEYDFDED